jgi:apolipoprotein N-acyltransferase
LLLIAVFGVGFVPAAQATRVAHLVQPLLPQAMSYPANWDALHAADMQQIDRITIEAGKRRPGLIVWPEVPAPFSLQQKSFAERAANVAAQSQSRFLLGIVDWKTSSDGTLAAYNSAAMLDPQGREEFLYDKIHLVPFSEYVPWRSFFWFAKDLTGLIGEFHHGTRYAVGQLPGGRFSVFICYEAVFPNQVRRFVQDGAGLLINLSNDGWFGRSAAPAQHLAMARVRAAENRRWLLRDTNNGYTVAVDPYGRIVARLATDVRAELDAPYDFRNDVTFYTRWGDWIAMFSAAFSGLILIAARFSGKPATPATRRSGKAAKGRRK